MRKVISFIMTGFVAFATACSSIQPEQAIPLPASTPFDSNQAARNIYLDSYVAGYRSTYGISTPPKDYYHGPYRLAREAGWNAGFAAANRQMGDDNSKAGPTANYY